MENSSGCRDHPELPFPVFKQKKMSMAAAKHSVEKRIPGSHPVFFVDVASGDTKWRIVDPIGGRVSGDKETEEAAWNSARKAVLYDSRQKRKEKRKKIKEAQSKRKR